MIDLYVEIHHTVTERRCRAVLRLIPVGAGPCRAQTPLRAAGSARFGTRLGAGSGLGSERRGEQGGCTNGGEGGKVQD